MYTPGEKKSSIRRFQPQEERPDRMTESMYHSQKTSWNRIKDHIDRFPAHIQKQFLDMKKFIDMYDNGLIKHWHEFYKTAEEIRNGWNDCSDGEYIRKYNHYYRDTGISIEPKSSSTCG